MLTEGHNGDSLSQLTMSRALAERLKGWRMESPEVLIHLQVLGMILAKILAEIVSRNNSALLLHVS